MKNFSDLYWELISRFKHHPSGDEEHHVWPRWLGHSDEIVRVSQRHHACLHFIIWLHEQTGESASAFIATASGWRRQEHSGISQELISRVAAWNMSRVTSQLTTDQRSEFGSLGAQVVVSNKLGWHGLSADQRTLNGQRGVQIQLESGVPARAKHWVVTHPNGQEERVFNLAEFCRLHNLSKAHMCSVVKGHRKHHKQFTAREA